MASEVIFTEFGVTRAWRTARINDVDSSVEYVCSWFYTEKFIFPVCGIHRLDGLVVRTLCWGRRNFGLNRGQGIFQPFLAVGANQ